jgi:ComF family protein
MRWIHALLDLVFPPKCILCGKLLKKGETDLCKHCRVETPEYPSGKRKLQFLDSFTSVWYYEEYPRKSILRYKFGGRRHYAPAYGRILAMKILREQEASFDCLTWVPVSPLRKLSRGFDQVALLALNVGKELEIQPVPLLKKIRHNRRQSGIPDAAMRRANVLGAYRAENLSQIQGKKILLLDDVLTTGATVEECARVLLTAGAKEVHCAAIAAPRKY